MICKEIKIDKYVHIAYNKYSPSSPWYSIKNTRPVLNIDDKLYRYKKGYEISLTEDDIDTKKHYSIKDTLTIISDKVFDGKEIELLSKNGVYLRCVGLVEDRIEITNRTKRDIARMTNQKNKDADKKIMRTFFAENIEQIVKKYGMHVAKGETSPGVIYFNNTQSLKAFIWQALEKTLGKELENIGIKVELNKSNHNPDRNYPWINLDNAVIKES